MSDILNEIGLKSRYAALTEELRDLRKETLGFSHIGNDGSLTVETTNPGYVALQKRISNLESKLGTVDSIVAAVQRALGEYDSIDALNKARQLHSNTIESAPVRAFDLFRMKREVAISRGDAVVRLAMPTEIPALLDGYQTEENSLKAAQTAAQEALVPINEIITTIHGLSDEARAALQS